MSASSLTKKATLAIEDQEASIAHQRLLEKEQKTPSEEKELSVLSKKLHVRKILQTGALTWMRMDTYLQPYAKRLRAELVDAYGDDTPVKRTLIDRFISEWNVACSYEKMFNATKYKANDDFTSFDYSPSKTRYLKEVRQGIAMANDQMIRIAQALENICRPQVQVKIKNAFIAQNQQFNQAVPPRDLADDIMAKYVP